MTMLVTQQEVDQLLEMAKEATRKDVLGWKSGHRYDESVTSVGDQAIQFVLTLKRNPSEIKAHFRTKQRNIQLARIDDQKQHLNPDGERILGPHLHWFKQGHDHLEWAEAIDWYDAKKPLETMYRFLELIHVKFAAGIQEDWV